MSRSPFFMNLIVNEHFQKIKPPLSPEAYQKLENNILTQGCHYPIICYKRVILDGYKRYEICSKNGKMCVTKSLQFASEAEALSWMYRNELKRDNLPTGYFKYFIGSLYHSEKEVNARKYPGENQSTPSEKRRPPLGITYAHGKYTQTLLSNEYALGASTIYKYSLYSKDIDAIRERCPQLALCILEERIPISIPAVSAVSRMPLSDMQKILKFLNSPQANKLTQIEINILLQTHKPMIKIKENEPGIKQIPQYDPDAEVSSLTLTIPSWISSIKRTLNSASFPDVSSHAKDKLDLQLFNLRESIIEIEKEIKDNHDG